MTIRNMLPPGSIRKQRRNGTKSSSHWSVRKRTNSGPGWSGRGSNFPCTIMKHPDLRYQTRYPVSMIENPEFMKKMVERNVSKMKKCDGPALNAEELCVFIPGIALRVAERDY